MDRAELAGSAHQRHRTASLLAWPGGRRWPKPAHKNIPGSGFTGSPGYLSGESGWLAGGGGFGGAGPVVWCGEGFSFGLPDRPGRMGLFYVAYRTYPQEQLFLLPAVGAGGGGFEGTGGWFASVGLRMLYFPRPRGYAVGLGVDYLMPLAGQAPRGWMVRLLIGGGER